MSEPTDRDEIILYFKSLSADRQLRVLAIFAHALTVIGRGAYNSKRSPEQCRELFQAINEKLHWVCGRMEELTWHPDDCDASVCLFGLISDDEVLKRRCDELVLVALAEEEAYPTKLSTDRDAN